MSCALPPPPAQTMLGRWRRPARAILARRFGDHPLPRGGVLRAYELSRHVLGGAPPAHVVGPGWDRDGDDGGDDGATVEDGAAPRRTRRNPTRTAYLGVDPDVRGASRRRPRSVPPPFPCRLFPPALSTSPAPPPPRQALAFVTPRERADPAAAVASRGEAGDPPPAWEAEGEGNWGNAARRGGVNDACRDSPSPSSSAAPWDDDVDDDDDEGGNGGRESESRAAPVRYSAGEVPLLPREATRVDGLGAEGLVLARDSLAAAGLVPPHPSAPPLTHSVDAPRPLDPDAKVDDVAAWIAAASSLPAPTLRAAAAVAGLPASGARPAIAGRLAAAALGVVALAPLDPAAGLDCGSAFLLGLSCDVRLHDVPTADVRVGRTLRRRPDAPALGRLLLDATRSITAGRRDLVALLEEPQIIPHRTGALSGYWSGMYHGVYVGALAACLAAAEEARTEEGSEETSPSVLVHPVKPASWKRDLGLVRADKAASVRLAGKVFPGARPWVHRPDLHHGRAEALLLAAWGMRASLGSDGGGGGGSRNEEVAKGANGEAPLWSNAGRPRRRRRDAKPEKTAPPTC